MGCCKNRVERIIEGWGNFIFRSPETEAVAKRRVQICAVCNENKFEVCMVCKCPIPMKTRSMSEKCPKGLW